MPSLRRSFSSPSVRSSPYPSSLSSANPAIRSPRPSAPLPRRSSGSATAERRVLADIEWWRVYDGQCDLDLHDHVHEDVHTPDGRGGVVTLSPGGGTIEPLSLHSFSMDPIQSLHLNSFAALSIAPFSPQSSSRHSRDSSVESTPELPAAPLESVESGLANLESCLFDHHLSFLPVLTRAGGRHVHPSFGLRSVSAPGLSHQGTLEPDFADMGGDSFSLDQNLFRWMT